MIFLQYAGDTVPEKFNPDDVDNFNVSEFDNPLQALEFYIEKNSDIASVDTGSIYERHVYVVRGEKIKPFVRMYFDASDYETVSFHLIADIRIPNDSDD